MFTRVCPQAVLSYRIDGYLVALGSTTWPVRNLASVRVEHLDLAAPVAAPRFDKPEPSVPNAVLSYGLACFAASMMSVSAEKPLQLFVLLALFVGGVWLYRRKARTKVINDWKAEAAREKSRRAEWERLAAERPRVFNLVFDSSSGRGVALSTFSLSAATTVHDAIVRAMRSDAEPAASGEIRIIDTTSGPIEKLYEMYWGESLR